MLQGYKLAVLGIHLCSHLDRIIMELVAVLPAEQDPHKETHLQYPLPRRDPLSIS